MTNESSQTARWIPLSVRTRNAERLFFVALLLLAWLIFYLYGFPVAAPLKPIAVALLITPATLGLVLPGLWFSEQIKLAPSPLLRKWLSKQPIQRRELTNLLRMIPAGWGLFVIGVIGALVSMAFGLSIPRPTGNAAVAIQILKDASPLGIASMTFANAVVEECLFHLTLLAAIAWVVARCWPPSDDGPTPRAMWLAIALQAPIASAINLQGREHGIRLVLDAHTAYGVILGWLYWRYGFEASLIATWTLVATASGLSAAFGF